MTFSLSKWATNEELVHSYVNKALAGFGKIEVLVNNAGFGLLSALEKGTYQEIRHMSDTNVFGMVNVLRAVIA